MLDSLDPQTAYDGLFRDPEVFGRRVHLLWLSAGTAEARFHQGLLHMHAALGEIGIPHQVYESAGTSHEWQTWRRSLHAFAPLLFRAENSAA